MEGASVLLTVPKAATSEMLRKRLTDRIESDVRRIVFVHAGAGYGKTTLMAQLARGKMHPVWLSLTGESDILAFADALCGAIRQAFPLYGFQPSECLPFFEKENFTSILANAMIGGMEQLSGRIVLALDDLHTVRDHEIKDFSSLLSPFFSGEYAPAAGQSGSAVARIHAAEPPGEHSGTGAGRSCVHLAGDRRGAWLYRREHLPRHRGLAAGGWLLPAPAGKRCLSR